MADVFSRKAAFILVKENDKAVRFHADRFIGGSRDSLALQCYQLIKQEEKRNEKANG